ncbi:MAG: PP2C family protein-serine/threonine phosphatase [Acidimicrobiales bacterium]
MTLIDCGWATAAGPRADNQDRCATSSRWVVVSDGVGGQAGGGVAAELCVGTVVRSLRGHSGPFDERQLDDAVQRANGAVRAGQRANQALAGMAATLTMAIAASVHVDGSRWLVASIGDSSAWHITRDRAAKVTEDHTLATQLVTSGVLAPETARSSSARHALVRAIGMHDRAAPDTTSVMLASGDALLVASDGVTDVLDAVDIHHLIARAPTAQHAARRAIDAALRRRGRDNVTAAVVRHLASSHDGVADPG